MSATAPLESALHVCQESSHHVLKIRGPAPFLIILDIIDGFSYIGTITSLSLPAFFADVSVLNPISWTLWQTGPRGDGVLTFSGGVYSFSLAARTEAVGSPIYGRAYFTKSGPDPDGNYAFDHSDGDYTPSAAVLDGGRLAITF